MSVDPGISMRTQDGYLVITAAGDLDLYGAPSLREAVVEAISRGNRNIVIDLQGVEFLDSSGLGVLVGARKRVLAEQGSLRLVLSADRILKVFRITGLTKVFSIHPTLPQALADLSSAPGP